MNQEHVEQFRRLDLGNRSIAQIGIYEAEKPFLLVEGLRVIAFGFELFEQFVSNDPKSVGTRNTSGAAIDFALNRRINTFREQALVGVAASTRLRQ